jgi:hypothetical protein
MNPNCPKHYNFESQRRNGQGFRVLGASTDSKENKMSKLTSLALASALMLGAGAGIASAQSTTTTPSSPPPAEAAPQDCGPGNMGDGCGMGPGMGIGPDGMGPDGEGWGHHRGRHGSKHARMGGHGRDGHGRHGGGRMMRIIDANADGVINDDEAASMADFAFMRMDRDRDGAVSEAEFTEGRGPGGHGRHGGGWFRWLAKDEAEAVLKVRKDKFASLDADKNGSVSKTEFFAEAKTKLAAADADKDGKVTPWEFRASVDPMK